MPKPDVTKLGWFDRTIDNCTVDDIPAGSTPKFIKVALPGEDGAIIPAWWSGFPNLAVSDVVSVRYSPGNQAQYVISGTSGSTATSSGGGWPAAGKAMIDDTQYDTIAAAITAATTGDVIKLGQGTFTENLSLSKTVTLLGLDPARTTITDASSGDATIDITADGAKIAGVTVEHTGAGTTAGCVATDNAGVVLENCILSKPSGSASVGYGFWMYGAGSARLTNCRVSATGGTTKRGLMTTLGSGSVTVEGGQIGGDTADIYTDDTGAVFALRNVTLANGLVDCAGVLNWEPEDKISTKNLLYDTLTYDVSWQLGTTLNDVANDTYGPTLWTVLNKSNAPDISAQAGGSTDPFAYYFRCTFDASTEQAGIVQFLEAQDTYPLRGQVVSLSADLWGSNVSNLRMAVVVWTSTADSLTSDVVSSWSTGNPALATNWAYIGTPASIAIGSTRARYAVNNLLVPTNATNLGVFIWTPDSESSGDLWNVARVQLERGPVATKVANRGAGRELEAIQRHYWKSFSIGDAPGTGTANGMYTFQTRTAIAGSASGSLLQFAKYPARMRTTPTVTFYSTTGTSGAIRNSTAGNDRTGCTASNAGDTGFRIVAVSNASANAIALDDVLAFHVTADARL